MQIQWDSSSKNLLHFLDLLCVFKQGYGILHPRGYLLVHVETCFKFLVNAIYMFLLLAVDCKLQFIFFNAK